MYIVHKRIAVGCLRVVSIFRIRMHIFGAWKPLQTFVINHWHNCMKYGTVGHCHRARSTRAYGILRGNRFSAFAFSFGLTFVTFQAFFLFWVKELWLTNIDWLYLNFGYAECTHCALRTSCQVNNKTQKPFRCTRMHSKNISINKYNNNYFVIIQICPFLGWQKMLMFPLTPDELWLNRNQSYSSLDLIENSGWWKCSFNIRVASNHFGAGWSDWLIC